MIRRLPIVLFALLVGALSACADSPAAPDGEAASLLDVASGGGPRDAQFGGSATLERLFGEAVGRVAREHGEAAAKELVARIRSLQEAAKKAREAGDEGAFRRAMEALHAAMAETVLRVFGPPIVGHLLEDVSQRLDRLGRMIEEARAAGHDVAPLIRVAEAATRLRDAARGALGEGKAGPALLLVTRAADVLAHVPHAGKRGGDAPGAASTLDRLFHEALRRVVHEHGEEAIKPILTRIHELQAVAKRAREAGDEGAFRRASEAIRVAMAETVIRVLGAPAVGHVLEGVNARLERLAAAIAEAEKAGRDVTRLKRIATAATELREAARTALAAGEAVRALLLAVQAADLLG